MFCTSPLVLSEACVQWQIWLFCVLSWHYAFQVRCSGIFWMVLRWFQLPLFLLVSLVFTHHMRCISILRSLYFRILAASFSITYYYDYWLNYTYYYYYWSCRSGSRVAQLVLRLTTGKTTRVSNPGCPRDFYLLQNRPGCPTKPSIRWIQRFFPGGKAARVWSSSLASILCWG